MSRIEAIRAMYLQYGKDPILVDDEEIIPWEHTINVRGIAAGIDQMDDRIVLVLYEIHVKEPRV